MSSKEKYKLKSSKELGNLEVLGMKNFVICTSILGAEFTGLLLAVSHYNFVLAFLLGAVAIETARIMAKIFAY